MFRWVLLVLLLGLSSIAFAQTCGFMACEQYKANYGLSCHECIDDSYHAGYVALWNGGTCGGSSGHVAHFSGCNCGARPDLGGGSNIGTRSNGKRCVNGCLFKPNEPVVSVGDQNGQYWTSSDSGWTNDGGAQCNPMENDPDEGGDGPDPVDCNGDLCVKPPEFPDLCALIGSEEFCAPKGECSGNALGYVCVDTPTDDPEPPPPPDGPVPGTPPSFSWPCMVNGVPCDIDVYQPPFDDTRPCPEGQHRENGQCVPDEEALCWNGEPPVNGQCPPLPEQCPDGSDPVHGQCVAPWDACPNGQPPNADGLCEPVGGVCPDGSNPVNGMCAPGYQNCPDGSAPVNGMCSAPPGVCPNGSRPVNGQCPVGAPCDPATDPDQCQGDDGGIAGGGDGCGSAPFCSGDQILCNVLRQQWETRCALSSIDADGLPTDQDYGPTVDPLSVWGPSEPVESPALDSSGWLGGGSSSCPPLPSATFMDYTVNLADVIPCSVLHILSLLILAGGLAQGLYIVGRA